MCIQIHNEMNFELCIALCVLKVLLVHRSENLLALNLDVGCFIIILWFVF